MYIYIYIPMYLYSDIPEFTYKWLITAVTESVRSTLDLQVVRPKRAG